MFEKKRLGEILCAPFDVILTETNVVHPDIMFVRQEHRSLITSEGLEGPPDLVIEILSASTEKLDRGLKRKLYARTGVEELWIVDPESKIIECYQLQQNAEEPMEKYEGPVSVKSLVLPGFSAPLSEIFPQ